MKYAYLLAKVYRYFKKAEVKSSGFDCQLICKMSLLLLNAEAHAWKLKTAHSESLLTIALASQECRDAWIKNSRDLQESKAKAPYLGSQNCSIPFLISMETVMGQMIHISTKAAF